MWVKGTVQNAILWFNSLSRFKKIVLFALAFVVLLYYLLPYLFSSQEKRYQPDTTRGCLEDRLLEFQDAVDKGNAFVHLDQETDASKQNVIYVGNGKMAVAVNSQNGLYIRLNRALSLPVKYWPVIQTIVQKETVKEASVLDVKSGIAYKIQAVQNPSGCMYVDSQVFAHRSHPSLLIQDIRVQNPTKYAVTVEFDQIGASGWQDATSVLKTINSQAGKPVSYRLTSGVIQLSDSDSVVAAAVGSTTVEQSTLTVMPGSTVNFHFVTVVNYTRPISQNEAPNYMASLLNQVEQDMAKGLSFAEKHLRLNHMRVWGKLWESGFSLSYSKASGVLNGDKINRTIYYILSNVPAPMHDASTSKRERNAIEKVLYFPDRCYQGHSTLIHIVSFESLALILSFGPLHFHNQHLEFNAHPRELHRDYMFRRINYGNNTHVNISVVLGEDNKASLFVSLDRNDKPYYACDAGCLDAPIQLSNEWQKFPVKLTEPLTGILYITADKQHMEELKHAIHVKEIAEAPAHEHHIIALHKHGHHFGGLPTFFWVSIAFLITVFHLFLFKLVYNEYCQGQDRYRGRYNL
ncbi:hypothetical protein C0Q70_05100 [Pomacea canaliculata]|uniref:Uncharacterized protein n=1 Tax=Pomacea canaliculata TaxID=400727 RepID=A0A2T7PK78_POMCA|nr:hypothetical protein C0Q70_05100 [Pomacea canaliculata]